MKVLHVLPALSPELGGPTEVALNSVRYLRALGVDARILATDFGVAAETGRWIFYRDVPVWFAPSQLRRREYIFSWQMLSVLPRMMNEFDLLDLHYLFTFSTTASAFIAKQHGVPYTVRTMGQLTPWALSRSSSLKTVYRVFSDNHILRWAASIQATTGEERGDVEREFSARQASVVPLGVEAYGMVAAAEKLRLRIDFGLPEDSRVVLFFSRLHPKKRPDLVIRAFSELEKRVAAARLVLAGVGEPAYERELRDLVLSLALGEKVTFLNFVTGERKKALLQCSDIFVLPSYSENFGLAVAEAAGAGLPVLVTKDVQIATDLCNAGAARIIDATSLADVMADLIDRPMVCDQMGRAGVELVKEVFSWPTAAQALVKHYEEILGFS